ncbi:hypothetical protein F4859DRAFT_520081 [Xylaria cf. heliscus]|nr:hypothetical protein F4859DRAFT_520081 [Xylaria cf. heliscus]
MPLINASAGGNAIVGNGNVTYIQKGALVKSTAANSTVYVYVSIPSPATSETLTRFSVQCKGSDASIDDFFIHYGRDGVYNGRPSDGTGDFTVSGIVDPGGRKPNNLSHSINVALKITFSTADSNMEIYSVTLGFGTASTKALEEE